MDPNGTLALQEPDRVRHAVLGRDAQAQVNVVGHRMPFQQLDPALTAQFPKDWPDPVSKPSVEDFAAVLRYDHDVVLAFPPHMGKALPFVHRLLLPALRGLPGRWSLCHYTSDRSKLFGSHGHRPWIYDVLTSPKATKGRWLISGNWWCGPASLLREGAALRRNSQTGGRMRGEFRRPDGGLGQTPTSCPT